MNETVPLRPLPLPDEASAGFWEAAKEGRLAIQRCGECKRWNHAPSIACPSCGSFALCYEDVSGRGRLHSWTTLAEPPAPGFRDMLPLVIAVVELDDQEGLLIAANLLDADPAALKIGLTVEVAFERVTEEVTLPQFRPAES